jgi:hypothetical protein
MAPHGSCVARRPPLSPSLDWNISVDRSSTSDLPSSEPSPDLDLHGLDLLRHIFLRNFRTGVHSSVFCDDIKVLRHTLSLHNNPSINMTVRECRLALIFHLLTGACAKHDTDLEAMSTRPDRTACRCINAGFKSAEELSAAAFNIVLSANAKTLATDHLLDVAAFFRRHDTFHPKNRRRQAQAVLEKERDLVFASKTNPPDIDYPPVQDLFRNFEKLPKPSLVSFAS